jgi:nucleoside-diphosphate-sugar epimerase
MKVLVTGSAGHLGEALVRSLRKSGHDVVGLDILESDFTSHVGSIVDRSAVQFCMKGVETVLHAAMNPGSIGTAMKRAKAISEEARNLGGAIGFCNRELRYDIVPQMKC